MAATQAEKYADYPGGVAPLPSIVVLNIESPSKAGSKASNVELSVLDPTPSGYEYSRENREYSPSRVERVDPMINQHIVDYGRPHWKQSTVQSKGSNSAS